MKILGSAILASVLALGGLGVSSDAQARDHDRYRYDRGHANTYYDGRYDRRPVYNNRYDDRRFNNGYGYDRDRYNRYDRYDRRYSYCNPNRDRVRDRNQAALAGALIGGVIASQTGDYNQGGRAVVGAATGAALGYGIGNSSRNNCY